MCNKNSVSKILDSYFKTQKNQFDKNQFEDISVLIKENILKSINDKQVEINIDSTVFNEIFLEYIENTQANKIPQNIKDAFDVIDKFEKQKKSEFGFGNIINAYSIVIDGLKSYIFYLFHTKGIINVIDFFKSLTKKELYHYDKYLFNTILLIDIDKIVLYEILSLLKSNDMVTRVPEFCSRFGKIKPQLAHELYNYALQQNDKNDVYILSNLLMGLFESDTENAFSKTKDLLKTNPSTAYFTLGRLKYKQEKHIEECFDIAKNIDKSDTESLLQIPYVYKTLIENPNTPNEIRDKCFSKMQELFLIDNEQLRGAIFMDCQLIQGYEEERYKLLVKTFLPKSQNYYNRINDFFCNFSNPDYFFHLFAMLYDMNYRNRGAMIDIRIFSEALSHFWSIDQNTTEQHLLDLLSHDIPYLRIGAVDLIRSKHLGFYDVNLLSLDTDIKQLRALEVLFFHTFYDIDRIITLILTLKNSTHENVISYLQTKLSELIIESYHDHLYEIVAKHLNDKDFLKPLKENLDLYHKIKEEKNSINDLNPHQNEHDLMNLYYALEHEEQQKMMRKINSNENSFLSMVKQTTIVRGHSWKIGDKDVSPLGHMEHSFALDLNMYKNPDLFDYTHHVFNSEF